MLCVIKRINIISITIIFIISCLTITSYAATKEIDSITLDASDYNTSDALENNISKYLSNPDIEEVIVITENTPESYYDFPVKSTHSGVSPLTTSPVYYQIKSEDRTETYFNCILLLKAIIASGAIIATSISLAITLKK